MFKFRLVGWNKIYFPNFHNNFLWSWLSPQKQTVGCSNPATGQSFRNGSAGFTSQRLAKVWMWGTLGYYLKNEYTMSHKMWHVKEPSQLDGLKCRVLIALFIFNLVSLSKQVHQPSVCFATSWQIEQVCTKCAFRFHGIQSNCIIQTNWKQRNFNVSILIYTFQNPIFVWITTFYLLSCQQHYFFQLNSSCSLLWIKGDNSY